MLLVSKDSVCIFSLWTQSAKYVCTKKTTY